VTKNSFIKNYKDINFDTLKERHDNFAFGKTIETQHQVHDTIHFTNMVNSHPDIVLYPR
jgi:hypothetical protein